MFQKMRKSAAFTLIELLVVVIIVAVLAAVGVPLLSANVNRARASEAEAGLGTIRTGMRARLAELGAVGFTSVPTLEDAGIATNDLNGRFFADGSYSIAFANGLNYCVDVDGSRASSAPRRDQVSTGTSLLRRAMLADGSLYKNVNGAAGGLCTSATAASGTCQNCP